MDTETRQPPPRIALIDGNSFYCACERALCPALADKPVIVLSNNDGCAIARTAQAKALGVRMGAPWFRIRHLQARGLVALSANFPLYGDMSDRMMRIIGQFSPRQEIYSIDESFLDLTGLPGTGREIGDAIRQRIGQWIGIPACVGIGPSKTLAKLANHLAKELPRLQGICDLSTLSPPALLRAIRHVPVAEVWGVGRRLAPRLRAMGIDTAADLAMADPDAIRQRFSIVMEKTARELRGESCLTLDETPAPKQQILCSRSFGQPVRDLAALQQAVAVFTTRAAEKLRAQASMAAGLQVFARTSHFRQGTPYAGSAVVPLSGMTDSTPALLAAAHRALREIYRPGIDFAKAGVCLFDLRQGRQVRGQPGLFDASARASRAMAAVDALNARYGRHMVQFASAAHDDSAAWRMRQERKSPGYTTDWHGLAEVRA